MPKRPPPVVKETPADHQELIRQITSKLSEFVPTGVLSNFHIVALAHDINRMRKELAQPARSVADIRKVYEEYVIVPKEETAIHDDDPNNKSHFDRLIYHAGLPPAPYWPKLREAIAAAGLPPATTTSTVTEKSTTTQSSSKRQRGGGGGESAVITKNQSHPELANAAAGTTNDRKMLRVIDAKTAHRRRRFHLYKHQALFLAQWQTLSALDAERARTFPPPPPSSHHASKQKLVALAYNAAQPRLELALKNCDFKQKNSALFQEDFVKLMDFLRTNSAVTSSNGPTESAGDNKIEDDPSSDGGSSQIPRELLPAFLQFLREQVDALRADGQRTDSDALAKSVEVIERLQQINSATDGGDADDWNLLLASIVQPHNSSLATAAAERFNSSSSRFPPDSTTTTTTDDDDDDDDGPGTPATAPAAGLLLQQSVAAMETQSEHVDDDAGAASADDTIVNVDSDQEEDLRHANSTQAVVAATSSSKKDGAEAAATTALQAGAGRGTPLVTVSTAGQQQSSTTSSSKVKARKAVSRRRAK